MVEKIENVEFANNEYTRVRFVIVNEDKGTKQLAELRVPENYETGVNKYWDIILDQCDIESLKQDRLDKIEKQKEMFSREKEKQESAKEARELKKLFDLKSSYIKLPFVQTEEDKSTIRKAPNEMVLNFIIQKMMDDYLEQNKMDSDEFFDEIEDAMYEDSDDDSSV